MMIAAAAGRAKEGRSAKIHCELHPACTQFAEGARGGLGAGASHEAYAEAALWGVAGATGAGEWTRTPLTSAPVAWGARRGGWDRSAPLLAGALAFAVLVSGATAAVEPEGRTAALQAGASAWAAAGSAPSRQLAPSGHPQSKTSAQRRDIAAANVIGETPESEHARALDSSGDPQPTRSARPTVLAGADELAGTSASERAQPPAEDPATQPETRPHSHEHHPSHAQHRFTDTERYVRMWEDPARAKWQKPREVIEALRLKRGDAAADLGAGSGYFTLPMARAVGKRGKVYAVDIEPGMIEYIRKRAEREKAKNVVTVLAAPDDARLPARSVDLVFICNTWHHIEDRVDYLRRLGAALRPGARIAIVDYQKRPLPVGPPVESKLDRDEVVREFGEAGFELTEEPGFLPYQYFLLFTLAEHHRPG